MTIFHRRQHGVRGAFDKMRRATRRFTEFCDRTIGVPNDDGGKTVMRELRRFLTRDVPRYFRRLPIPYSYADVGRLTIRDWLQLTPLLVLMLILMQRSVYAPLGVVFLILLVNA